MFYLTRFVWSTVSWFAVGIKSLVSTYYGLLLICFFRQVVLSFSYKFSFVKKFKRPIVYSEIPLGRDLFSYIEPSAGKQWGLIDRFLYSAPYSIEGFLMDLSESFINDLCVKICNSSNTQQFFHIPLNNVSKILWKNLQFIIFCIFFILYLISL